MTFLDKIKTEISQALKAAGVKVKPTDLELPPDSKMGDFALPCFNFSKELKKAPNIIAKELANKINPVRNSAIPDSTNSFKKSSKLYPSQLSQAPEISNRVKAKGIIGEVKATGPYVNFFLDKNKIAAELLKQIDAKYGESDLGKGQKVMIEYSSPNTNKPQHIGHIRNNMLGYSLSLILEAIGYKVIKTNAINDRGIHICKSMLAWQKWGKGETPEKAKMKGDHLVGKYYVMFGLELQKERENYFKKNKIGPKKISDQEKRKIEDEFLAQSPLMKEAHEMLIGWEQNDKTVRQLWQKMNKWVYDGWERTYKNLGVSFDKNYYESKNYLLGKEFVKEGLKKNIFYKEADSSVWIDLTGDGLDKKILLRADGTSVYMTQDMALAKLKYDDYKMDKSIYVVASEQDYHFKVLFLILKKLGFKRANGLYHLSYGMVSLPEGKIKSREGKTADADDLIVEAISEAKKIAQKSKKEIKDKELGEVARKVGLAGLKFFVLKSDPKKDIVFVPQESIAFEGFTGPYIQYTYTRIASILKKAGKVKSGEIKITDDSEWELVKSLMKFPLAIASAAENYNPALLAAYLFELSRLFAGFYETMPVLKAEPNLRASRLALIKDVQIVLKKGLGLLGIEVMERM